MASVSRPVTRWRALLLLLVTMLVPPAAFASRTARRVDGEPAHRTCGLLQPQAPGHAIYLPTLHRDAPPGLRRAGQVGGAALAVGYAEPYVVIGNGPRVLVVDVADADAPRVIGESVPLGGVVQDIETHGTYVIAVVPTALVVLSIADPASPRPVTWMPFADRFGEAAVSGDVLCVAGGSAGLLVFDIADPVHPRRVGTYPTDAPATAVTMGPRYAAVRTDDFVHVIDLVDPTHPRRVGLVSGSHLVAFVGDTLYVDSVAWIRDFIAAPGFQMVTDIPGGPYGWWSPVTTRGDYLYIAGGDDWQRQTNLAIVDVSVRRRPVRVDAVVPNGWGAKLGSVAVAASAGRVFLTGGGPNPLFQIVDVEAPEHPRPAGVLDLLGEAEGEASVSGRLALIADLARGVRAVDIADPVQPRSRGLVDFPDFWPTMALVNEHAVFDYSGKLEVVDLSVPGTPRRVGGLVYDMPRDAPIGLHPSRLATSGDVVLLALTSCAHGCEELTTHLLVVDIADPAHPVEVGRSAAFAGEALDVDVGGGLAVVVTQDCDQSIDPDCPDTRLWIFDIERQRDPCLLGQATVEALVARSDFAPDAGYVYLASSRLPYLGRARLPVGLYVVDVRTPSAPRLVGHGLAGTPAQSVAVVGDRAYLAVGDDVIVADVSDPAHPVRIQTVPTEGNADALVAAGRYLYVSDGSAGLQVFEIVPR
jgi:hypothetical protein